MNTLEHLQQELKDWQQWVSHEQEFYDKCTDEYTKGLLQIRVESGIRMLSLVEKELNDTRSYMATSTVTMGNSTESMATGKETEAVN